MLSPQAQEKIYNIYLLDALYSVCGDHPNYRHYKDTKSWEASTRAEMKKVFARPDDLAEVLGAGAAQEIVNNPAIHEAIYTYLLQLRTVLYTLFRHNVDGVQKVAGVVAQDRDIVRAAERGMRWINEHASDATIGYIDAARMTPKFFAEIDRQFRERVVEGKHTTQSGLGEPPTYLLSDQFTPDHVTRIPNRDRWGLFTLIGEAVVRECALTHPHVMDAKEIAKLQDEMVQQFYEDLDQRPDEVRNLELSKETMRFIREQPQVISNTIRVIALHGAWLVPLLAGAAPEQTAELFNFYRQDDQYFMGLSWVRKNMADDAWIFLQSIWLDEEEFSRVADQVKTYLKNDAPVGDINYQPRFLLDVYVQREDVPSTPRPTTKPSLTHQPRYSKDRLLIERFRVRQAWDNTNTDQVAMVKAELSANAITFLNLYTDAFVDLADKYIFAPSAVALASSLPAIDRDYYVTHILGYGETVWIELEQPIQTIRGVLAGFSFSAKSTVHTEYAQKRVNLPKRTYEKMRDSLLRPGVLSFGLDATNSQGDAIWTLTVDAQASHPDHVIEFKRSSCPSGGCQALGRKPGEGMYVGELCDECQAADQYYMSFYLNMMRLVAGELSETEVREAPAMRQEVSVRKTPQADKPWKFKETQQRHSFQIITFNVQKRVVRPRPEPIQPRGSWVDQCDPEQLFYVDRHIGEKERTLRHPKFWRHVQTYGDKVKVRSHEKRIPMKLETIRLKMKRAIAEQ